MERIGLSEECKDLALIIENLKTGKENCDIGDPQYALADVIDYLQGYLQELIALDARIVECGNTPDLLKEVYKKYSELWVFQLSFYIASLPSIIGRLWRYPKCDE